MGKCKRKRYEIGESNGAKKARKNNSDRGVTGAMFEHDAVSILIRPTFIVLAPNQIDPVCIDS